MLDIFSHIQFELCGRRFQIHWSPVIHLEGSGWKVGNARQRKSIKILDVIYLLNICPSRFPSIPNSFRYRLLRVVKNVKRPFRNTLLSNVAASNFSTFCEYHIFPASLFGTPTLQLPLDIFAVDGYTAVRLHF